MKIYGLTETIEAFNNIARSTPEKLKQQVKVSGRAILNESKKRCPVYSVPKGQKATHTGGNLRKSGFMELKDNGYNAAITYSAPYAPFVEFGTGGLVSIPAGFEELAAEFKGKTGKKHNMRAQPFLIPALLAEQPNFIAQCERIVNEL